MYPFLQSHFHFLLELFDVHFCFYLKILCKSLGSIEYLPGGVGYVLLSFVIMYFGFLKSSAPFSDFKLKLSFFSCKLISSSQFYIYPILDLVLYNNMDT